MLAAFALFLGACSDENDKALDEASALAEKLCKCPDAACADQVKAELEAMKERLRATERDYQSGKQTERAVKIALRWDECMEQVSRR